MAALQAFDSVAKHLLKDPCCYCFKTKPKPDMTIEHITPLSKGGARGWVNQARACKQCNQKRGNRSLLKWLIVLSHATKGGLTKRQQKERGLWFDDS